MSKMVLQNPAPKNLTIFITLQVEVNYGDAENRDNPYSSEAISEILNTQFKCPICGVWHLNPDVCGMDEMVLSDIEDRPHGNSVEDDGAHAEERRIEEGQRDWSEGRR